MYQEYSYRIEIRNHTNKEKFTQSVLGTGTTQRYYHFCHCGNHFIIEYNQAIYTKCTICKNDYFIYEIRFSHKGDEKVSPKLSWDTDAYETDLAWHIKLSFHIPREDQNSGKIIFQKEKFYNLSLSKKGIESPKECGMMIGDYTYDHDVIDDYCFQIDSLFSGLEDFVREYSLWCLYRNIIEHRIDKIEWLQDKDMNAMPILDKLEYINFFLFQHKDLSPK